MSACSDPQHLRRSIRLHGYDYSQAGAYFVTIVTSRRLCLFGDVVDGEVKLSRAGKIVEHAWLDLPRHYQHVVLGMSVIMPNHFHGIVILTDRRGGSVSGTDGLPGIADGGNDSRANSSKTRPYMPANNYALSEIVRAFKSFSAIRINQLLHTSGHPFRQRNCHDHIIRNDREMDKTWRYIESNPVMWAQDEENPSGHA